MALGFGFRCGFLGLLHMDIVKERLEREFDLELIATAPNVEFHVIRGDEMIGGAQPGRDAAVGDYDRVEEPVVYATIITPADYLGRRVGAVPVAARRDGRHELPHPRSASRSTTSYRSRRSSSTSSTS